MDLAVEVEIEIPQFERFCSATAQHVRELSTSRISTQAPKNARKAEPFNPMITALQNFGCGCLDQILQATGLRQVYPFTHWFVRWRRCFETRFMVDPWYG
jgi:hypothetical protein